MAKLYAFSDLHLRAPFEPFLFTRKKESTFAGVVREANARGATILLAGDVLDLTSMTPPARGLSAFFQTVGLPDPPQTSPVGPAAQIAAVRAAYGPFFEALHPFAADGRLHVLAGNHDCAIESDEGKHALAGALGIPVSRLALTRTFRAGDYFFACHGNEYDASNRTDLGCHNPGSVITSALYFAIIPALNAWGFAGAGHAVPAVRPEENIVTGLEQQLGADEMKKLLRGFVHLLQENGYFTGFGRVKAWLATHLPFLLTPGAVRRALADDTSLKELTRKRATAILSGREGTSPPGDVPKVVVMGHTHELDATRSYVNLGSWIDHVRGLDPDEMVLVDRSLPALVVDGARAALHDCCCFQTTIDECPILWHR